jgi:uroporphyrin-3 C-methyltransferase
MAALALLLALAGLAASGYLYYRLQLNDPLAPVISRLDSAEAETRRLQAALSDASAQQADDLAAAMRQQRQALEEQRSALLDSLNSVSNQGPPSSREWKVAEVGYLLRIANHRLLMERDVEGALALLIAADEILLELDDFAFYQVRSRLAEETRALKAVETRDLPGIYLELEAMKRTLRQLPLKLPQYLRSRTSLSSSQAPEDEGFWAGLRRELASKFRIRRFDSEVKPLLAPEEAVYLELNLRLMLERAQLAALRREQLVFTESLETAALWLEEYLDGSDEEVSQTAAELRRISTIVLDQDLPDISGSLSALQAVRRSS